jgi:Esterase PHB depolymerase
MPLAIASTIHFAIIFSLFCRCSTPILRLNYQHNTVDVDNAVAQDDRVSLADGRVAHFSVEDRDAAARMRIGWVGCCRQGHLSVNRSVYRSSLADSLGFAVIYPQQQSANNPENCFSWFLPGDTAQRPRRGAFDQGAFDQGDDRARRPSRPQVSRFPRFPQRRPRHNAARRTRPDHRGGLEGRRTSAELIRPARRRGEAGNVSSAGVAPSQRPSASLSP